MTGMIHLDVEEEYGYRLWYARLSPEEYEDLRRRWQTMRGLTCLVPVPLIIPQARVIDFYAEHQLRREYGHEQWVHCHIHESDDSRLGDLGGCPEGQPYVFEMDGVRYDTWEKFHTAPNPEPYPTSPVSGAKLYRRGDLYFVSWHDFSEAGHPRWTEKIAFSDNLETALDGAVLFFNDRVQREEIEVLL